MDPSASICIAYDSLKESPPATLKLDPAEWYSEVAPVKLTPGYTIISVNTGLLPQYCDTNRYQILQRVKDAFNTEGFIQARDETNPFEQIGRSIFINRASAKLGNIDAVHHVAGEIFTFDRKQSDRAFTFCDVAAGPGGFTQYLQYRFPNAKGYGMTLRHEKLDWSTKFLNMSRFTTFYGADNTGNLYTNWDQFNNFVLAQQPGGVDLVTADGGFDLEDGADKTLLHHQEFLSSRLLLTQALVGIGCSKVGGNFVLKCFDTVTSISAHILYVLAQCFERILIFKPVSSRPANAERYILCMHRRVDVGDYYDLLAKAATVYTENDYLATVFSEPLPGAFQQWLTTSNNLSIDRQLQAAQNILLYIQGQSPEIPQYDIPKFLLIWNLPDTPLPAKRSLIRVM